MRLIGIVCAAVAAFVGYKLATKLVEYQELKALEDNDDDEPHNAKTRRMYEEASGKSYPETLADSIRNKIREQQGQDGI